MAERFFTKIANDVLEASEALSTRFEEGLSVLWPGGGSSSSGSNKGDSHQQQQQYQDEWQGGEMDEPLIEEELMQSPLQGIADSVLKDIMSDQIRPETPWEHFQAFRHAITWSDPFIIALLIFNLCIFSLALYVSRRNRSLTPRLILMIFIGIIVRAAERINKYGAHHWRNLYCTQNYFDKRGTFIAIMLCAPLLIDSFIMLSCFLREASQLLVQVKTNELKKKRRKSTQKQSDDKKNSTDAKNNDKNSKSTAQATKQDNKAQRSKKDKRKSQ